MLTRSMHALASRRRPVGSAMRIRARRPCSMPYQLQSESIGRQTIEAGVENDEERVISVHTHRAMML